jgi:hypothetical protein
MPLSGGCQCGAVRFVVEGEILKASLCHCRMCQKAFGAYFAPLAEVTGFRWTKGTPGHFRSSDIARRGFCVACGTPLTYEPDAGVVEVAIGAFDDPSSVPLGAEDAAPLAELARVHAALWDAGKWAKVVSRQHPDAQEDAA